MENLACGAESAVSIAYGTDLNTTGTFRIFAQNPVGVKKMLGRINGAYPKISNICIPLVVPLWCKSGRERTPAYSCTSA